MPLTDEQRKQLVELKELEAKEQKAEADLARIEKEKKEAEAREREAIRTGDPKGEKEAREQKETLAVSESTAHALLEQLKVNEALMTLQLEKAGTDPTKIEAAKRRRIIGPPR